MAVPMIASGMKKIEVLIYTILSGIPTAVGAYIGIAIGSISNMAIGMCLAFAAGTMTYVVSGDMLPESKKIYKGRLPIVGQMIGFILGIIVTRMG